MKNNQYIYIETYGCSANKNNSEILKGILTQSGYSITNNGDIADIIILNTCIVKSKTENKIKRRIQDINKIYKNKLLIISGCMPETDAKQIKQLNPKAILLGTHHFKQIIKLIKDYNENKLISKKQEQYLNYQDEQKILLPKIPENKLISITQISEGCLGECSYCKTRLAKGALFSYEIDNIIKSIQSDLQNSAKEVWLTSQDCASYGINKYKKQMLPELLNKIFFLKHNFKLRLGMSNPNHLYLILNELLDIYENKKIYKFLHIPIQSASDKVLKNMNRKYKINQVYEIIEKFRKKFPDITIATDIISGYPTETDKDNQQNINFIKKIKPDIFNLSKFSLHKDTEIYKQIKKNKIKELPNSIINKRTTELMQIHRQTALENKQKFLDKTIKVFVNKKLQENLYESRDDNYNIILIKSKDKSLLGKNIKVNIEQIGVHHMIGEIQDVKSI